MFMTELLVEEPIDQLGAVMSTTTPGPSTPRFTDKQGQYLAFINAYILLNGRPPAEADMERHFRVTPPTVHRMVVELERRGLIRRQPRQPRSIEVLVSAEEIPALRTQPIKTSVAGY
jgi:DNA-binding MarR family transcriptional regulator